MAYLVLVRHGISDYNKKGLWTGWDNPPLAPEGFEESRKTGAQLSGIHFDLAYSADQIRSVQTLGAIGKTLNQDFNIIQASDIRERNYGIYTLKNKWQVQEELGEAEFKKLRRGWSYPIEQGESLKQVYEREIPYFQKEIEPKLRQGKNIIIASSGNALRALVKYLENISDEQIPLLEIGTGEAYVYNIDSNGKIVSKQIRGENPNKLKV